ncbi:MULTISPECIES: PA2169 family four-helix-bundle protein [unclassified Pseudomonas]|uniref:ferritin-like domain-containing protein n=3 Tax=unclassified Pseudomonas TaxID=196821 RepID=UPI002AC9ADE3|nr:MULTISPECIES: PA2169 family four-helix-bundle protein [unclassified Pseudomonas]MEB0040463.1 PA2169 family four-helix-bundle protein [Pseudomonas sp. MH10]MEB0089694.1 PA2169 family four-helix-bundle protein [Pseudomonas sp. CCI4.2]MEB0103561.1 PA2169 family four-helix-bundle protein [Pseudomonas sp. CCI3.2]MEB0121284.1 PA2169 family four-helix-bundle protein [Pseudomonas sp. CCI1.2]MEB0128983.1 PA2169 family four-helix-bundle protein [Pseudomonas sp. CCI2.4]
MTDINKEAVSVLNDLIETSKDGEKGFHTSAEDIKNPTVKGFFITRSQECAAAVRKLQAEVRTLGGDPDDSSSVGASLHRAWVDLKSAVTGKSDEAILNEVERGEDHALKAYKEALEKATSKNLPSSVVALIQEQLMGTQRNHDQVKALRDQARARS